MVGIFLDWFLKKQSNDKVNFFVRLILLLALVHLNCGSKRDLWRDCKKLTESIFFESLILAQDERWRRALGMQVERLYVAQGNSKHEYRNSKQYQNSNDQDTKRLEHLDLEN